MPFRNMVQTPKLRGITQGSVFNHARSDDFHNDVLGMVISARCDLAQKKQEKFVYVPLVKVKHWFDFHLVPKLTEEYRKTLLSELKTILTQNKNADTVIETFGPEKCLDLLAGHKDQVKYQEKLTKLKYVESCMQLGVLDKSLLHEKKFAAKIDDIITNKTEGFFIIDNIIDFQDNKANLGTYIAILGEPRPIHRVAALGIAEGLDHSKITEQDRIYDSLTYRQGEMSYVLCNIASPYIELALQRFSNFYSRIGIDAPTARLKELLISEAMA